MFLGLDRKNPGKTAVIDDSGEGLTYGELCQASAEFAQYLPYRTLIFILADNSNGALIGYLSALSNRVVPLLIGSNTPFDTLYETYRPEYLWLPENRIGDFDLKEVVYSTYGYALVRTGFGTPDMYDDLALLLTTSGSTGSPKLVRHSYRNIEANAENVVKLFGLTAGERAMASLPMYYTMGLSVITSHLHAGATVLLSGKSLLDPVLWKRLKDGATSFTGVPYSFDVLSRLGFFRMSLPDLKTVTQGGGKLTRGMWMQLADYAAGNGIRFIATYGQSECTGRMAYLPAHLAGSKICSIGIAEPGGRLSLIDHDGNETFQGEASGEMVYRGENVTLGYATCLEDLLKGDENHGVIRTGDLAHRDADGCYYIIGRRNRFVKLYGLRIGLDEVENMIRSEFDTDCYCSGDDGHLLIKLTDARVADRVPLFIEEKTHLFHQKVKVQVVDRILRNEVGKVIEV